MYDNTCKYLAEQFPEDLTSWLLGERISLVELKPTELSLEPIRADSMILLTSRDLILHLEFQTIPDRTMSFRMVDYRLRAYRKFPDTAMRQIVIYLKPSTSELVYETSFNIANTSHQFEVIRLWEQPAELFLNSVGLYPFAPLGKTDAPESVLTSVAAKIQQITSPQIQANVAATTSVLAGLVLDKKQIRRVLQRDIMRESVIYQEILAEGEAKGKAEGKVEGLEIGLQQEKALVIRQLARKLGNVSPQLLDRVNNLSIERVEALGEALLDFTGVSDLENFLE
jgi:predicted transposase/invertase (TIGR01784 family)